MPKFSRSSLIKLETCHEDLQKICNQAIKIIDFSVLCGHRTQDEQEKAYRRGTSKLTWPYSKHNSTPSLAVDLLPFPVDWFNVSRFHALAGVLFAIAAYENINLRWGGTWGNLDTKHKPVFVDLPHYELIL